MVFLLKRKAGFKGVKDQRGFSLIVTIIVVGSIGILLASLINLMKLQSFYKTDIDVHNVASMIRNNVYANLRERLAWEETKKAPKNASAFACLTQPLSYPKGCCTDTDVSTSQACLAPVRARLSVFDSLGQKDVSTKAYVDHTLVTQGFSLTGSLCSTFPSEKCPFQYEVTWEAVCLKNNCKIEGITQILITATFRARSLKFLNGARALNENLYTFKMVRDLGESGISAKSNVRTFDTPGTYSLTLDKDVKSLMIESWGGGGGGGGGEHVVIDASDADVLLKLPRKLDYKLAGGGGGGGGYIKQTIANLTGGEVLKISVAKGGEGVNDSHRAGFNGDDTIVEIYRPSGQLITTVVAKGGGGGRRCIEAPPPDDCGLGGAGGLPILNSAYLGQGIVASGADGGKFNDSKDQYLDPSLKVATGTNSDPLNEQKTIYFSSQAGSGSLVFSMYGNTQTMAMSGTETATEMSDKILTAVRALCPEGAVVTMVSKNWSSSSISSFVLDFGGTLATVDIPPLVIESSTLISKPPQDTDFRIKNISGNAGDDFVRVTTESRVFLSKYAPRPLIRFGGGISGTGTVLDGSGGVYVVKDINGDNQFTIKLASSIPSDFNISIGSSGGGGGKGGGGSTGTIVDSLGYLEFVGTQVAVTQLPKIATKVTYNYSGDEKAYRINYYGGHGGNGGGGGGSGGSNDHDNVGVAPFSPGGGGTGKMLRGKDKNGIDSRTQDGAPGKVIVWF